MAEANIRAVITAEDRASGVIKKFGTNVDSTSKNITGGLSASVVAVGLATTGIVAFGKKSLDAFTSQELAVTRLKRGIQNVTSATSKNVDALIKQAVALQKTTRFSDEAYISAQGILTTFQLNQDAIAKLTPRLADMSEGLARVTGELPDLEGNAILVAKAIGGEDVVGLVGALRRVGVVMTKHQQDLLQTGTVQQRVAVITKVLDQNFRGMADAAGATTSGKITELKNQFNDLQEKIGQLIATALTPLINSLNAHPVILTTVTIALGALAVAFVGVKVAAAISAVVNAAAASITGVGAAATFASAQLSGLVGFLGGPVAAAGWASFAAVAIGAFILIQNKANETKAVLDRMNAGIAADNASITAGLQQIKNLADSGKITHAKAAQLMSQLGKRAGGGPVSSGMPYLVGEVGPELFVPKQSGEIIPNNKVGMASGGTVNININAGAFMGTDVEARKFAQIVLGHLKDSATSKNMSLTQLMGT